MDMTSALDQFRQWPIEDQLQFVEKAWDEIAQSGWQPQLTDAQKAELDRRLAAHEADPSNVLTWDQVVASLGRSR